MCKCNEQRETGLAWYQLNPGTEECFETIIVIDGLWESIRQCRDCGQFWHQQTSSGHADIEYSERITPKDYKRLLKKHGLTVPAV